MEFWGLDEDGNGLDFEEDPYLYNDRYIPIDPIEPHEAYRFMERFFPTAGKCRFSRSPCISGQE